MLIDAETDLRINSSNYRICMQQ